MNRDRLYDQLHSTGGKDLRCNIKRYLKRIFIADFLDIHVVFRMLNLIFDPDNRLPPA